MWDFINALKGEIIPCSRDPDEMVKYLPHFSRNFQASGPYCILFVSKH